MLNGNSNTSDKSDPHIVIGLAPTSTPKTKSKTPAKGVDIRATLAEMAATVAELQAKLALAKGTENDIIPPPEAKKDLLVRIEEHLRAHVCTTEELAKSLGEDPTKVQEKIKSVRKNLADVGTPDEARWVWKIGDETPTKELKTLVAALIEGHAMTSAQLSKITGAKQSRINGVLVDLQRDPEVPIYNVTSSKFRYQWMILPKTAELKKLPPKAKLPPSGGPRLPGLNKKG